MVEIAICLAIIGIALVAIIGVLPIGINVQKDNRQETLIDQDAAVLLEGIRNGGRGLDDLTNYVVAVTNYWTQYNKNGGVQNSGANGYTYAQFSVTAGYPFTGSRLTNGANIIGLLTTPEYTDLNGFPISTVLYTGGISNHVVAWMRSLSGPADEKPPQTNAVIIGGSFSYKIICNNAPTTIYIPPLWNENASYNSGDEVCYTNGFGQLTFWRAAAGTKPGDTPGQSSAWIQDSYSGQLAANLHELRLTYLWPLLPKGNTGNGRHTFATTVAGQISQTNVNGQYLLYFYQPQLFTAAP